VTDAAAQGQQRQWINVVLGTVEELLINSRTGFRVIANKRSHSLQGLRTLASIYAARPQLPQLAVIAHGHVRALEPLCSL
jgi:hypothetical protein